MNGVKKSICPQIFPAEKAPRGRRIDFYFIRCKKNRAAQKALPGKY